MQIAPVRAVDERVAVAAPVNMISLQRRLGHALSSGGNGLDDVVIARAAAQIAFELGPDRLLV